MVPHPESPPPEIEDIQDIPGRTAAKVSPRPSLHSRRSSQGQHSEFAKTFLMNKTEKSEQERKLAAGTEAQVSKLPIHQLPVQPVSPSPSTSSSIGLGIATEQKLDSSNNLAKSLRAKRLSKDGVGAALSDTPLPSAPSSPKM
jgi:hypothetical protein